MTEHEAAIRAARAASNHAIRRRDVDAIAAHLLPNFHIITGASATRHSREESIASWNAMFASDPDVVFVRTPEVIFVSEDETMAEEHGRWSGRQRMDGELTDLEGVYAAKWHATSEGWRLQAEIFTPLRRRAAL